MTYRRILTYIVGLLTGYFLTSCGKDYPATIGNPPSPAPGNPGSLPPQTQPTVTSKRLYLSNDKVRVGIDLNMGGAITYLSEAGSTQNMVNNVDYGRSLQTSLYGGPWPYIIPGKKPPPDQWINLGWNPVQTGDVYNNPSRVVSYLQSQNQLYVKTVPLIWPLFNEPAECTMEHWLEIKDNAVHVRCRFSVNRADTTQYEARTQETPCVYLNGPWYRVQIYTGTQPFTNEPATEITDRNIENNRYATEGWIALLNDKGRGVGLYRPNSFRFASGGFGLPKVGGEFDNNSTSITNNDHILIDHNGTYEYEYKLILGTLADIRQFVYAQPRPAANPNYTFTDSRLGWYYSNTTDTGWPIQNQLNVRWNKTNPANHNHRVCSPMVFWRANDNPTLYVQAAFQTQATSARLTWRKPGDIDFLDIPGRTLDFPIIGDGQMRVYEIPLSGQNGWDGVINQISFGPGGGQDGNEKGAWMRLKSVTATKP